MKTTLYFLMVAVFLSGTAFGQTIKLPPNPNKFAKRSLGENGGSLSGDSKVNVSSGGTTASKTIVIQYVAVSAVRAWKNGDGRVMNARLLAFSAPREGEKGPVEVIRKGKVRFLLNNHEKPIDYPLDQLSQVDQIDIKAIAQAAKGGAPENQQAEKQPADE